MIAFASLFLGLIVGTQAVQVLVDDSVQAVEYRLDGELATRIEGAPWRAEIPFGADLVPHELVATAFDSEQQEVGTARQWINLPRAGAEGRLVIDEGESGRGSRARLAFESVEMAQPTSTQILLDGHQLEVEDVTDFELPPYDPESLHYLRVVLEFGHNAVSIVEATFGGTYADQTDSSQMALPILVRGETPPGFARELQGRITKLGAPVRVLGVEEGPAEVVVVRDQSAQPAIDLLARNARRGMGSADRLRFVAHLRKDQRTRILSPFAARTERSELTYELFQTSQALTPQSGGLFWHLLNTRSERRPPENQRLADAVAVAGMSAARNNYRRAVVLLVGDDPRDASNLTASMTRSYLESIRVPLFVWSLAEPTADLTAAWGAVANVKSIAKLERQANELGRFLEHQRIIWIEGIHLPQRLDLTEGTPELAIAM
jgi:hypothetical protein